MRGTPSAYAALLASERKPSDDTLYFISNPEDLSVTLYLGTKKIAGGEGEDLSAASIDALKDVLINSEELTDKAFALVYNKLTRKQKAELLLANNGIDLLIQ